jgi:hypothetical protein
MAPELAWAKAVAPRPDARMHTNVNERFMRFYNSFILLIEVARVVAKARFNFPVNLLRTSLDASWKGFSTGGQKTRRRDTDRGRTQEHLNYKCATRSGQRGMGQ